MPDSGLCPQTQLTSVMCPRDVSIQDPLVNGHTSHQTKLLLTRAEVQYRGSQLMVKSPWFLEFHSKEFLLCINTPLPITDMCNLCMTSLFFCCALIHHFSLCANLILCQIEYLFSQRILSIALCYQM